MQLSCKRFLVNSREFDRESWSRLVDSADSSAQSGGMMPGVEEAKEHVAAALETAVARCASLSWSRGFAIGLSGGVDSALMAAFAQKQGLDFFCVTVGVEGCEDLERAAQVAGHLGIRHVSKSFSLKEAEGIIRSAVDTVGSNPLHAGVACVGIASSSVARERGASVLFSGLGADEAFAGYRSHAESADIGAECLHRLRNVCIDLERDTRVGERFGFSAAMPFLEREVLVAGMRVPAGLKIRSGMNKWLLRRIASDFVPEGICSRKKRAAQYGSGFDRAMEKLAKSRGFRLKREYLESLMR